MLVCGFYNVMSDFFRLSLSGNTTTIAAQEPGHLFR